jgi:hypothetical protein
MEEIDPGRYVLPVLLALLMVGSFLILVTNGGGDGSAGAVDRPARPSPPVPSRTSPVPAVAAAPGQRFTKVQAGDTPTSIAERAGISTQRLLELNPSVQPDALKPGQTLKLLP